MTNKGRWNVSFIIMIMAVLVVLYTSIKVAVARTFWIDNIVVKIISHVPTSFHPFFIHLTEMGDKTLKRNYKKADNGVSLFLLSSSRALALFLVR